MSTLSDAQRAQALAVIRDAVERFGSENRAADELGLSQQLVNKAVRRGEIGIVALRKMATKLGRQIAGVAPEGDVPNHAPAPLTVAPDSPQPASPSPASPTPTSPGVSNAKKAADGRWRLFAAAAPHFSAAATEALEAGASERLLDAASDRLLGTSPTYSAAVEAIGAAAQGAAAFKAMFFGPGAPGAFVPPPLVGDASRAKKKP